MTLANWWKLRNITTVVALALLAMGISLGQFAPTTGCQNGQVPGYPFSFPASEVVAKPWLGPHHVYAIFIVPIKYRYDPWYTARLVLLGVAQQAPISPEGGYLGDSAQQGYYLRRVYLPTRTALWFMLSARFGDLKMPCNWWLVIGDRPIKDTAQSLVP